MAIDHSSQTNLTFKEQLALLVLNKIMSKEDYDKVVYLQHAGEIDNEVNGIYNTPVKVIENYLEDMLNFAIQMVDIMDKKLNDN
jgi:hypothetical protein